MATSGDIATRRTYAEAMDAGDAHIVLTLETSQPIEIGAFVGAFTSLAAEYERFISERSPDLSGKAEIFVREVRAGSIVADLVPLIAGVVPLVADMNMVLIVENFVVRWGARFSALIRGDFSKFKGSRSELKDWIDGVTAIASDPNGSISLQAATFEDGKNQLRAALKFESGQARTAKTNLERRLALLDHRNHVTQQRVLMVFTRSDVNDAGVGKSSGERVKIEEIADTSLPLIYASELAEERIKHEIRDGAENVFRKGFVVDAVVKTNATKPVAYAVTAVHQVIDLPD